MEYFRPLYILCVGTFKLVKLIGKFTYRADERVANFPKSSRFREVAITKVRINNKSSLIDWFTRFLVVDGYLLVFSCYITGIKMRYMKQAIERRDSAVLNTSSGKFDLEAKMKMSPNEQYLYMQLHKKEILERVKALDEMLSKLDFIEMSDEEIADMVSKDRRERYEESLHH